MIDELSDYIKIYTIDDPIDELIYKHNDWPLYLQGDCIATCLSCLSHQCSCDNPRWTMDSEQIRKEEKRRETDPDEYDHYHFRYYDSEKDE
jgi:hypothetical protein